MVKDVVCGMEISKELADKQKKTAVYENKTYFFCSIDCKKTFLKNPGKYVSR